MTCVKRFILFLNCLLSFSLIFSGFTSVTMVNTPHGLIRINQLKVGDKVISLSENLQLTECAITKIATEEVDTVFVITMENGEFFAVSENTKLYIPEKQQWMQIQHLHSGDVLLTKDLSRLKIVDIIKKSESIEFFNITVANDHNFCIMHSGILVHNMNIAFEWIIEHGPKVMNVLVEAGTAAVVSATYLLTSKNQKPIDYSVPQLPGKCGDRFRLNGKDYIYMHNGWKIESELSGDEMHALQHQLQGITEIGGDNNDIDEPAYSFVAKEGWTNNGTCWKSQGERLYDECCTIGADGVTVVCYDLARDAQITKDLQEKRKARKQNINANSFACPGGPCPCGHPCGIGCNCECSCGCGKQVRNPNKNHKKQEDEKNRQVNDIHKSEYFESISDRYEVWQKDIYRVKKGKEKIEGAEYLHWDFLHGKGEVEAYSKGKVHLGAIDPKTNKLYKPAVIGRKFPG